MERGLGGEERRNMKQIVKKLIPKSGLSLYHKSLAYLADSCYKHPSRQLKVIGITGTKGKSTVANLVWHILTLSNHKVGLTSTANIKIGDKERMNPYKMTMPGRFEMQRLLKEMVDAGCDYAIIETTSQGILQWRHACIDYNVVVFTNLYPEHIEAHGGFENYKKTKLELFKINPKVSVINIDDENHKEFLDQPAEQKYTFSQSEVSDLEVDKTGINFTYKNIRFEVPLLGEVNLLNILAAIKIAESQEIKIDQIARALYTFPGVPGRMELINEGQDFTVIVDYAHEPRGVELLYKFLTKIKTNKIITVTGSCGGGRDEWVRKIKGELADKYCDYVIVTNEDPYDEDPQVIIDQVSQSIPPEKLFKILDRKEAIKKAFELAESGDIVVLTAKGSEQAIVGKNMKKIPWDEREVARKLLKNS